MLAAKRAQSGQWGTRYLRTTPNLQVFFQQLLHTELSDVAPIGGIPPKISTDAEHSILRKILIKPTAATELSKRGQHEIYFKDYGETYWVFPVSFTPWLTPVRSYKSLAPDDEHLRDILIAFFNSSLFYWFYTAISDCWHFGRWHMSQAPIGYPSMSNGIQTRLVALHNALMSDLKKNRIVRYDQRIKGDLYEYKVSKSKPIIDEIDRVLAEHYGFTEEELDFIINYDIKYRMGRGSEDGEE